MKKNKKRKFDHDAGEVVSAIGLTNDEGLAARRKIINCMLDANPGEVMVKKSMGVDALYKLVKKDDDALVMLIKYFVDTKFEKVLHVLNSSE